MAKEKENDQGITAFHMDVDTAMLFYSICDKLKLVDVDQRIKVLRYLAQEGKIKSIISTTKTKEEYLKHLQDKFGNVKYYSGENNEK